VDGFQKVHDVAEVCTLPSAARSSSSVPSFMWHCFQITRQPIARNVNVRFVAVAESAVGISHSTTDRPRRH